MYLLSFFNLRRADIYFLVQHGNSALSSLFKLAMELCWMVAGGVGEVAGGVGEVVRGLGAGSLAGAGG